VIDQVPSDSNSDEELLDQAAYVLGSAYRKTVLRQLQDRPAMPSQIADENDFQRSHISRALGELESKGIVQSHSDGSRTKLYSLTGLGRDVADLVTELDDGVDES
jgi:DNA-binding HxlR family transcriptional regulator